MQTIPFAILAIVLVVLLAVWNNREQKEEVQQEEPKLTLRFTVKATKTKLRELKKFLDEGGYEYV